MVLLKRSDVLNMNVLWSFAQMMRQHGVDGGDMLFLLGHARGRHRGLRPGRRGGFLHVREKMDQQPNHADQYTQYQKNHDHGQKRNLDRFE